MFTLTKPKPKQESKPSPSFKERRESLEPYLGETIQVTGWIEVGQAKARGTDKNRSSAKIFLKDVYYNGNYMCGHVVIADSAFDLNLFRRLRELNGKNVTITVLVIQYGDRYGLDYVSG